MLSAGRRFARDGHRCTRCGARERLEVHHVRSLAEGGSPFVLDNLTTLCPSCHRRAEADWHGAIVSAR